MRRTDYQFSYALHYLSAACRRFCRRGLETYLRSGSFRRLPFPELRRLLPALPLLIGFAFAAEAQPKAEEDLEALRKRFPDAKAVFLERSRKVRIKVVNGEPLVKISEESRMLHLRKGSEESANESVVFTDYLQPEKTEAFTLIKRDGKTERFDVKDFQDRDLVQEQVFYNDTKERTFLFPKIEPGCITVLRTEFKLSEPRFLSPFFFSSYLPVLRSVLTITSDKGLSVGSKVYNEQSPLSFKRSSDTATETLEWEGKAEASYAREKYSPSYRRNEPHLVFFIRSFLYEGRRISYLNSPTDLYRNYYEFIRETDLPPGKEIQTLTDSLTGKTENIAAKAKIIFAWVRKNIKYIAFEQGMKGFRPESPDNVCRKRYADCKGMTALLAAMLRAAGAEASFAWVGTRALPYAYADIPTPLSDNHMVAVLYLEGQPVILDASDELLPFGLPSAFIQGKELMIARSPERFEIISCPVSKDNSADHTIIMRPRTSDILQVRGRSKWKNYDALKALRNYQSSILHSERDAFISVYEQDYKLLFVKKLNPENTLNTDGTFSLFFDAETEENLRTIQGDAYVNMFLFKPLQNLKLQSDRRTDLVFPHTFNKKYRFELMLPPKAALIHKPENSRYEGKNFGFEAVYEAQEDRLILTFEIYVRQLSIPKEEHKEWNRMIRLLKETFRRDVSFRE